MPNWKKVITSGSNAILNEITASGAVSASTYYGDGSNLTGISSDPFPYTGSAVITGSLEVVGDITGSGKINLDNGNGTIIIGNGAGTNVTTASNNVIIGKNAADIITISSNNVIIGAEAGPRYTTGYGQHVILGYQAGRGADQNNDDRCVIIGTRAGYQDVGFRTVAIGFEAAYGSNASSTISIGFNAHRNINANASNQIAIGYEAGYQAQGANSIFIGRDSGRASAGTDTQALGTSAAYDADGNYNVAIGTNAAYNVNGDSNIAVGYQSLRNASGIIYNNTIALGHEAGYAVSGSNNILLGYQAGYNLTGSNQLIIANNSSSALVTGDFANSTFNISGSVSASTYYGDGSNLTGISSDPFPYIGDVIITGSNSNADSASLAIANSNDSPLLSLKNDGTLSLGHTTANTTTGNLRLINRQGDSWMGGQNLWGNISAGILIQAEPTNTLYYRNLLFYVKSTQSAIAGVEKMRLDYAGNLGIGTSSPQERLHVVGNTTITGSNSLSGNYALKVANSSGTDLITAENDGNIELNNKVFVNGTNIGYSTSNYALNVSESVNIRGVINFDNSSHQAWIKTANSTNRSIKIPGTGGHGHFVLYNTNGNGIQLNNSGNGAAAQYDVPNSTGTNYLARVSMPSSLGSGGNPYISYYNGGNGRTIENYTFGPHYGWASDAHGANTIIQAGPSGTVNRKGGNIHLKATPGSGTGIDGKVHITGSTEITGSLNVTGDITTNTLSNISTTLASDSATNVDTFATATYTGAIYDYILVDATVGARAGQFMVAQDNGNITFTDTSTKHLTDSPIPEITAQINGANVEVQVTNGDGYTFKSFAKKL